MQSVKNALRKSTNCVYPVYFKCKIDRYVASKKIRGSDLPLLHWIFVDEQHLSTRKSHVVSQTYVHHNMDGKRNVNTKDNTEQNTNLKHMQYNVTESKKHLKFSENNGMEWIF